MEYGLEVRRRFERPSHRDMRADASGGAVQGTAEDRSLNVWVCMQVEVSSGIVAAVRFAAYGCPHFLASADWIAERLEGRPATALTAPIAREAAAALQVPTEKLGKLLVIEDALAACAARVTRSGLIQDMR